MDNCPDHYAVLGLPSGEEGARLSEKDISKAYRLKALELHPDKRGDDPNAHTEFQQLKASYEILKDPKARKLFDDFVWVKNYNLQCERQRDCTRRKTRPNPSMTRTHDEQERTARKLNEDLDMDRLRGTIFFGGPGMDRERTLQVSWRAGENHTDESLKVLLGKFGEVESVTVFTKFKENSAVVIMASKDAAAAAVAAGAASWKFKDLKNPAVPSRSPTPPIFRYARINQGR